MAVDAKDGGHAPLVARLRDVVNDSDAPALVPPRRATPLANVVPRRRRDADLRASSTAWPAQVGRSRRPARSAGRAASGCSSTGRSVRFRTPSVSPSSPRAPSPPSGPGSIVDEVQEHRGHEVPDALEDEVCGRGRSPGFPARLPSGWCVCRRPVRAARDRPLYLTPGTGRRVSRVWDPTMRRERSTCARA